MDVGSAYSSAHYRFQLALASPIVQRCYEIASLLEEASSKDLQVVFPLLIKSVFGFDNQPGWGLRIILRSQHPKEFDTVRGLLSPDGPVMRTAYRLMTDAHLKFDFPVHALPLPTRCLLEEGPIPCFYANKLQASSPGQLPQHILLNAFEYFVFHLAHFLVSPQSLKDLPIWANLAEATYPHIVEDYLHYFLPYAGLFVPPPHLTQPYPSPSTPMNSSARYPFISRISSPLSRFSSPSFGSPASSLYSTKVAVGKYMSAGGGQLLVDMPDDSWRSETVAQVFTELWLDHYRLEFQRSPIGKVQKMRGLRHSSFAFASPPQQLSWRSEGSSVESSIPYSQNVPSWYLTEPAIPTHDHVRLVRMLVKHMHYFANSALPNVSFPLNDLKRTVVPCLMEKKLYGFLRHVFDHWPLDASFRSVLETWLSYIQPWRYTDFEAAKNSLQDREDVQRIVDQKWKSFVESNLAFYTIIFQQVLPRLLRMDLNTVKNAYMLHRITKVFSQPHLWEMILEVDSSLQDPRLHSGLVAGSHTPVSMSKFSLSFAPTSKIAGVRQHLTELEGPGFVYTPMIGEKIINQVLHLLSLIHQAKDMALLSQTAVDNHTVGGFFSGLGISLKSFFGLDSYDACGIDDYTPANGRRLEQYLDIAGNHLRAMFKIPQSLDCLPSDGMKEGSSFEKNGGGASQLSGSIEKWVNSIPRSSIAYQGDPDLQPIRSYEVATLVRLLYQISCFFNNKYGFLVRQFYDQPGFMGEVCRQFLQPPVVCTMLSKESSSPTRHQWVLPPRLSLRRLASRQIVSTLLGYFFISYTWGHDIFKAMLLLMALAVLYAFCCALVKRFTRSN